MTSRIASAFATVTAMLLAACSTAPIDQSRSSSAAKELAGELAGRVAGPPQRCITTYRNTDVNVIDDWTIIYDQGSTKYVQNPRGGCPGISSGQQTIVTRQIGIPQLCEGDIFRTVDLVSKIEGGACVFGPFVPYTKPG